MTMWKVLLGVYIVGLVHGYGAELRDSTYMATTPVVSPIEVVGSKFFDTESGFQFFIKGVAYQRTRNPDEFLTGVSGTTLIDGLANEIDCLRDLGNFMDLGINVVRVYEIDTGANHDVCMNAYAKAGIYVLADLSVPELSINRNLPSWDLDLYQRYTSVVDTMQGYNNTLGFIAGNEVTNSADNTEASAFVKASIRDVKAYISEKGYRKISVGYATNDDSEIRKEVANYMVFSQDGSDVADFLGLNMYEWCGYSSYATSGYRERTMEFNNFPVPLFFSEYGCNSVSPRPFTEVEALYGSTMTQVWSGGIAYEYFNGVNEYGLVKMNEDGTISKTEDYQILKNRLNSVNPVPLHRDQYQVKKVNLKQFASSEVWKASSNIPPSPDKEKCECLESSLDCVIEADNFDYLSLKKEILSKVDCHEIESDSSVGYYGRFSDCTKKQKLSFCTNKYYLESKVCETVVKPYKSVDSKCKTLLKEAFAVNDNYDSLIRSRHTNSSTILNDTTSSIQIQDSQKSKSDAFRVSVKKKLLKFSSTIVLLFLAHGI